jgi:hypothetical protein
MRLEDTAKLLLATGQCNLLAEDAGGMMVWDYLVRRPRTNQEEINPPPEMVRATRQNEGYFLPRSFFGDNPYPLLRLLQEQGMDAAGRPQVHHGWALRLRELVRQHLEREYAGWDGRVAVQIGIAGWRRRRVAVVAAELPV